MREIKFRGILTETDKWVYGYLNYNQWTDSFNIDPGIFGVVYQNVVKETVGQFTGAIDYEGSEIYKDDIIKNHDLNEYQQVYWNEKEHAWYCRYIGALYENTERVVSLSDSLGNLNTKVGNIHDNPELLKQQ